MSEEVTNAVTQIKGLLNKYPDKTLEILQYVFGKDTIMKIINRPTYEELQQENQQLKEVIDEIREHIKDSCYFPELENYLNMTREEVKELVQILDKVGD